VGIVLIGYLVVDAQAVLGIHGGLYII